MFFVKKVFVCYSIIAIIFVVIPIINRSKNHEVLHTHIWMVYLNFKFYWVFSKSESQVDLKQPKAICLLSARKTVLDTDYIGSTKYNNNSTYFNKLNFTILSMHIISRWHISKTPRNCEVYATCNPWLWPPPAADLSMSCPLLPTPHRRTTPQHSMHLGIHRT